MQDILEHRTSEMETQLAGLKGELDEAKGRITHLTNQEAVLVQQNAKTSMQLSKEEKKRSVQLQLLIMICKDRCRKELESVMTDLRGQLENNEGELTKLKCHIKEREKAQKTEIEKLQMELQEKSSTLKEYQTKVSE